MNNKPILPTLDLACKLIAEQFPEYADLPITDVAKQGHDNHTYRLGRHMLIRMPTAADYALKVPKEQELLPQLAKRLSVSIPAPIKMGKPSADYPYPFSIYNKNSPEAGLQKRIINEVMKMLKAVGFKNIRTLKAFDQSSGPDSQDESIVYECRK
ncbi:MAG: phosphotransferase [Gammaproteobacteria bacterium]|nr:phosphotransferase [Gammaproteobacteria bacterium]MCD8542659.1 phosphotransferase [Gammaproteobacteria bacterium]